MSRIVLKQSIKNLSCEQMAHSQVVLDEEQCGNRKTETETQENTQRIHL